jgi:hypothetical protein
MNSSTTVQSGMGDLADFTFKGQCYDSGLHSKAKCTLCTRAVRLVYILKDPQNRSVPTGSCCFGKFRANPKLFKQLEAAQIWLNTTIDAERADTRAYQPRTEVQDRMTAWRALKHQALLKIRDYRRQTGKEWLPESLFELKAVAEKMPTAYKRQTNAIKWYDRQAQLLQAKILEVSGTR